MRIEWRQGEAWIVDRRLRQVRKFGAVRVEAMLAVLRDKIEAIEDSDGSIEETVASRRERRSSPLIIRR